MNLQDFKPYTTTAPRDLFNQAKLLKCLGKLCVMIVNQAKEMENVQLIEPGPGEGYDIGQDPGSGDIACTTLQFVFKGQTLVLSCGLNSREDWPLVFHHPVDETEYDVFTGHGSFIKLSKEFRDYLRSQPLCD